ncbi:MAG TPA: glycosyltransferase family 2 protein [Gaiellaceae bacterium]|nr:glycosyltransferase family 2 protein [Gaiellaceae bacterium]
MISAVVVSHGHAEELVRSLPALAPQVDEIVLIANVTGSLPADLHGARVVENARPLSYAANLNRGIAETTGDLVLVNNPDAVPQPGAVAALAAFAEATPRCGVAGPRLEDPDGSWQPSRRLFPTVGGTLVRRTPLRLLFPPLERQRAHYGLDERPEQPVPADWMLGGSLLLRRSMLDELGGYDAGFRMYGEEIDLCYRAARAGWERWYVPQAVVRHRWDAATDRAFWTRRTIWHWRSVLRFVRKHPERLLAR